MSIRLNPVSHTVGLTAGLTLLDIQTDMHSHMMSSDGASHIVRVTGHNETLFFHFWSISLLTFLCSQFFFLSVL